MATRVRHSPCSHQQPVGMIPLLEFAGRFGYRGSLIARGGLLQLFGLRKVCVVKPKRCGVPRRIHVFRCPARENSRRLRVEQLEDRRLLSGAAPSFAWELMPWADGLLLRDADLTSLRGQVIHLDFSGGEQAVYRGPVVVENARTSPFSLQGSPWSGREQELVADTNSLLHQWFAPLEVTFTIDRPELSEAFSTVYVGGGDEAFREYGSFWGLAEQVDRGNVDREDAAFVFTQEIVPFAH
ncbi:MAG: hypothetical protein FJ276_30330, partial [Planctomycetes bacterium]|nr:hypothetical protein [Planctomycetota bacterium]